MGVSSLDMVQTPWGDSDELRARMMPPGRGTPRDVAERNQRERLFASMLATVAAKGYEATRVADLSELCGVSRSAFYQHFEDKEACFLAMIEELVEPVTRAAQRGVGARGSGGGQGGVRSPDRRDRRSSRWPRGSSLTSTRLGRRE